MMPTWGLLGLAGIAAMTMWVAWYLATDVAPVYRARPVAQGALHTAVWSLTAAIYLTVGPDVGVLPTSGPVCIALGGSIGMVIVARYAWPDMHGRMP